MLSTKEQLAKDTTGNLVGVLETASSMIATPPVSVWGTRYQQGYFDWIVKSIERLTAVNSATMRPAWGHATGRRAGVEDAIVESDETIRAGGQDASFSL